MQHRPLVFLDIETTGGSARHARVLEVGALRVEGGRVVGSYQKLINPECPVPWYITRLTGIRGSMVQSKPTFAEIAPELTRFLDGALFIAHFVQFDYGFLREEYRRLGEHLRLDRACSVRLDRLLYPEQKGHGLDAIIARESLSVAHRHRAYDDAEAIWRWFEREWQHRGIDLFRQLEKTITKTRPTPITLSEEKLHRLNYNMVKQSPRNSS
ncbi:MAG: 3'-5' exonuclease [Candidatus Saccharimonadales bacterium]